MSPLLRVTLPDGNAVEVERDSTLSDVALKIGPGLQRAAIGAYWNGELTAIEQRVREDGAVNFITKKSDDAVRILRHSAAHLLAAAVQELFPDAQLGFGPPTDNGFYYDFVVEEPFTPEDLERIEKKMRQIAKQGLPFERVEMETEAATAELERLGYKLKAEYMRELVAAGESISFYKNGDLFSDMCRGPHVKGFGSIPAFKILSASGAYWRGDAAGLPMQRIHGTAFKSQADLDEYLVMLEEAKKRDHRKLGPQLNLFSFHEEAPGFPFWHEGGTTLWREVEGLVREELLGRGYKEVRTPMILTDELWKKSGHYDHYRDNMYFVEKDERQYAVKPMNCPGCCLIYGDTLRSYKELPMRMAEFGLVHRYELSGVLHGLFRVRGFVQDDAHVYCMPEQIEDEVIDCLDMLRVVYETLGFGYDGIKMYLSTRPKDRMGAEELWDRAEGALKTALDKSGHAYELNPGDGAFYGPKIDIVLTDSIGRDWQCGTVQLDFQMPQRFGLEYVGPDGDRHTPVMIHRAIVGSMERMLGIIIEHYAGKLPVWMSPVQAILLPITDKSLEYCDAVQVRMAAAGLRVEVDRRGDKIGAKIRDSIGRKIPYLLVVGDRETEADAVAVRTLDGEDLGPRGVDEFIEELRMLHRARGRAINEST